MLRLNLKSVRRKYRDIEFLSGLLKYKFCIYQWATHLMQIFPKYLFSSRSFSGCSEAIQCFGQG